MAINKTHYKVKLRHNMAGDHGNHAADSEPMLPLHVARQVVEGGHGVALEPLPDREPKSMAEKIRSWATGNPDVRKGRTSTPTGEVIQNADGSVYCPATWDDTGEPVEEMDAEDAAVLAAAQELEVGEDLEAEDAETMRQIAADPSATPKPARSGRRRP